MHGWPLFLSVFAMVLVAELPDKTALTALVLATRHRAVPVLLGAGAALTAQAAIAVVAGRLVSFLPRRPVHVLAGVFFVVAAVLIWRKSDESEEELKHRGDGRGFWRSAGIAFGVIFMAEWGDLTQLATAAMSARYRAPLIVWAGATLALWVVMTSVVSLGHRAGRKLDMRITKRVAALVFALVGALVIVR